MLLPGHRTTSNILRHLDDPFKDKVYITSHTPGHGRMDLTVQLFKFGLSRFSPRIRTGIPCSPQTTMDASLPHLRIKVSQTLNNTSKNQIGLVQWSISTQIDIPPFRLSRRSAQPKVNYRQSVLDSGQLRLRNRVLFLAHCSSCVKSGHGPEQLFQKMLRKLNKPLF